MPNLPVPDQAQETRSTPVTELPAPTGLPGFSHAARPGRQRGQDGHCRAAARQRATGSGAQSGASSAALQPLRGRTSWCRHRQDPLPFLRRNHPAGMLRNFRERDDAISPFPRKSTPVLLESNVFSSRFPRISPLTAADLVTVRSRTFSPPRTTFPAPFRAAPAASSPCHTPSRGRAGTGQPRQAPQPAGEARPPAFRNMTECQPGPVTWRG